MRHTTNIPCNQQQIGSKAYRLRLVAPSISPTTSSTVPPVSSIRRPAVVHHLDQLRTNLLPSLAQYVNEILGLGSVLDREQRIRGAAFPCTPCASNTVDVILRVIGVVVVDDKLYVVDIC